jgi:two-component system, chemotaxis family, chemotaxis protein CheY
MHWIFSAFPLMHCFIPTDEFIGRKLMEPDVLVVDDSAAIRKILQRVLHQTGMGIHTIFEAGDGTEALEILKTQNIGLVLSDINMPKMDGIQLLGALKAAANWRHIPVVMITTEGGETKVGEAVRLGAAGYVRKPFTADQIKEKLAGILEPALPL